MCYGWLQDFQLVVYVSSVADYDVPAEHTTPSPPVMQHTRDHRAPAVDEPSFDQPAPRSLLDSSLVQFEGVCSSSSGNMVLVLANTDGLKRKVSHAVLFAKSIGDSSIYAGVVN